MMGRTRGPSREVGSHATALAGDVLQGNAQRVQVCNAVAVATADPGTRVGVEGVAEAESVATQ